MYAYFKGEITEKNVSTVVLDCNGIGYEFAVSSRTIETIGNIGDSCKIYAYYYVREDNQMLFGFISKEEKRMFEKLITVNGIGPKAATSILSALTVTELAVAIVSEDANLIAKAQGIGRKTAARLILELKEKVDNDELTGAFKNISVPKSNSIAQEALAALMALGYSSAEAGNAINRVEKYESVEELITAALQAKGA